MDVGDIVYILLSATRRIRYKAVVTRIHEPRRDTRFWLQDADEAATHLTARLELQRDYGPAGGVSQEELNGHGLSDRALQHPNLLDVNHRRVDKRLLARFILEQCH